MSTDMAPQGLLLAVLAILARGKSVLRQAN